MTKKANIDSSIEPTERREQTEDQEQDDAVIGRALRVSLALAIALALIGLAIAGVAWFSAKPIEERTTALVLPERRDVISMTKPHLPLTDITAACGIDWRHFNAMEGEKLLPETMGGGVAIFDYDRDGDQDILFVGGTSWPWARNTTGKPRSLCLYANDGQARFTDVTKEVGLDHRIQAMGPAVGDFDNDGWTDLLVTSVGGNRLYQNAEGNFRDVTRSAGVGGSQDDWTTSAVWFDYDHDTRLDLFVCNYVRWTRELDLSIGFSLTGIGRAYGQPTNFSGMFSQLFHNDGGGKFTDVSAQAGFHISNPNTPVPEGKALGVSSVDVNRDGWLDLVVANDTVRNYLYLNQKDGTFEESGITMGLAFDRNGEATGAMGIDAAHFRNNGALGVVIGNFANEPCSLYVSQGGQQPFLDEAMPSGIGPVSRLSLTFGAFFTDLDLDGRPDVVCANGHLESEISKVQPNQHYEQPPLIFWNAGAKGSTELVRLDSAEVGSDALKPMVGRGSAYGDLDGDGDIDLVLVANGGAPRILRNDQDQKHHWVRLVLEGHAANRDAIGAVVRAATSVGLQTRYITATRGYLSQSELPVTFGLGPSSAPIDVEIVWPDGELQKLKALEIDQVHQIRQGAGG